LEEDSVAISGVHVRPNRRSHLADHECEGANTSAGPDGCASVRCTRKLSQMTTRETPPTARRRLTAQSTLRPSTGALGIPTVPPCLSGGLAAHERTTSLAGTVDTHSLASISALANNDAAECSPDELSEGSSERTFLPLALSRQAGFQPRGSARIAADADQACQAASSLAKVGEASTVGTSSGVAFSPTASRRSITSQDNLLSERETAKSAESPQPMMKNGRCALRI